MRWILKVLWFLVATFFTANQTLAQPENYNWFFSGKNGINFSTGNPLNITGGQITSEEGAAAVSDRNGQLLFYTDGVTVWNKNHVVMSNGQGLTGDWSSTQGCMIIPKTKDEKQYYIFTTDAEADPDGFQYSVVDMTLDNNLGAVTIKNHFLLAPVSEKITAVRHCNGKDYWLITHKYDSDAYYAYLATDTGVNHTPVISRTGGVISGVYYKMAGQLKASPDGKKLIALHFTVGAVLSDFNNQTGVVSNSTEIFKNSNAHPYGAEFSASSGKLYINVTGYYDQVAGRRFSGVFQYNLSLPSRTDIINSKYQVYKFDDRQLELGSMQRGPNGKIYMVQYQKDYLSVIEHPEADGSACNYVDAGLQLPAKALYSLPNLVYDYHHTVDSFRISSPGLCVHSPVNFDYTPTGDVTALLWVFDDPASGSQNQSSLAKPSHIFNSPGNYTVKLIKFSPCGNDTIHKQLTVGDIKLFLGRDTSICENTDWLLVPQVSGATTLQWQDGSAAPSYRATTAGTYWLEASNMLNGCVKRDSIIIINIPLPVVALGNDTSLCEGNNLTLHAAVPDAQFIWQDNSVASTYTVTKAGKYWVEASLNGCSVTDSINITSLNKPVFDLGPDQHICEGMSLMLNPALNNNLAYWWQDGSTNPIFEVHNPGLYYVDISNKCGTTSDTIHIVEGNCMVRVPSAFTPNHDGLNDQFRILGTQSITEFELKIFNRFGQQIFRSTDKNGSWDGTIMGQPAVSGTYAYLLIFKALNSSDKKILRGSFVLIR